MREWKKRILLALLLLACTVLLWGCGGDEETPVCVEGHAYAYAQTIKEATCTAKGEQSEICTVCGDVRSVSINAQGHVAGEWTEQKAPTCTETGSRIRQCTTCAETLTTESISATGHTKSDWIVTVEPRCEQDGEKHKECTSCAKVMESVVLKATGHAETKLVSIKPASCVEDGRKNRVCVACEKVIRADIKDPATGHMRTEWQITSEATCTKDGTEKKYCFVCESFTGEERTIDAKGHTEGTPVILQKGNCVTDEITEYYCAVCSALVRTDIKESTGHTLSDWEVDIAPTCTENGLAHRSCTVCGEERIETDPLEAKGHIWGPWETDVDVSCEQDGHRQRLCQREECRALLAEEAIRHEGHRAGEWNVVTKETCTEDGLRDRYCTVCEEKCAEEIIPATGHTNGAFLVETDASCTEDGVKYASCTVCHAERVASETIPAKGHDKGEWIIHTPVTCTTDGLRQRFCLRCEVQVEEEPILHEGHKSDDVTVIRPASCTVDGIQRLYCTVCETKLDEAPIPALGHLLVWTLDVAATCEQDGARHADCGREGCGAERVESEAIDALGHLTSVYWSTKKNATCTESGTLVKRCTRNGCQKEMESKRTDPLGHADGTWRECATDKARFELICARCPVSLRKEYKENVAIPSGTISTVNLTGYRIVYPANVTESFKKHVQHLAARISELTGKTVTAVSDATAIGAKEIVIGKTSRAATQTALASISGTGFAIQYANDAIAITGTSNLVALLGVEYFINEYLGASATVKLPEKAVSDRYLTVNVATGGTLNYEGVYDRNLDTDNTEETVGDYDVDALRETYYGIVNSNGTGRDYAYDAALALKDRLALLTGKTITLRADSTAVKTQEILIGRPDRAAVVAALAELAPHEYGIMVRDGRVIATGYGIEAWRVATPMLLDYLQEACTASGDIVLPAHMTFIDEVNDNWLTDFPLPEGLPLYNAEDAGDSSLQYLYMGGNVNLAAYEAYCNTLLNSGYRILTQSTLENSYFKTFTDKATGKKLLHVCYNAFANAGKYELDTKEDYSWSSGIPKSWYTFEEKEYAFVQPAIRIISAYVNETILAYPKPGTSIYSQKAVASDTVQYIYYNKSYPGQYSSSQTYDKYFNTTYRNTIINAGYDILLSDTAGNIPYFYAVHPETGVEILVELHMNGTLKIDSVAKEWSYLRLLVKRQGTVTLPSELLDPNQTYTKVTDSAITAVALAGGAVGTGYVLTLEDGRFVVIDGGSATNESPQKIWEILSSQYRLIWGREPSPEHPVEIAAWVITHGHADHMNAFWDFANFYGGGNGGSKIISGGVVRVKYLIANIPEISTVYNTGEASMSLRYEMLKIHDYFKYGFTFVKVQTGQKLYLANLELHTLITHADLNPSHIVTFNDTSSVMRMTFRVTGGDPVTFVSTGDAYIHEGRWLCAMYGNALKSDMVTLAHHGGPGMEKAFYKLVAPRVVWWPMVTSAIYYQSKEDGVGYLTANNWYSKVDQFVVLALQSVDYVYIADKYNITLDLTKDGPQYEQVRNAGTTTSIYADNSYELSRTIKNAIKVTKRPDVGILHEQYGSKHAIHNERPIIIKKTK